MSLMVSKPCPLCTYYIQWAHRCKKKKKGQAARRKKVEMAAEASKQRNYVLCASNNKSKEFILVYSICLLLWAGGTGWRQSQWRERPELAVAVFMHLKNGRAVRGMVWTLRGDDDLGRVWMRQADRQVTRGISFGVGFGIEMEWARFFSIRRSVICTSTTAEGVLVIIMKS